MGETTTKCGSLLKLVKLLFVRLLSCKKKKKKKNMSRIEGLGFFGSKLSVEVAAVDPKEIVLFP